MPSPWRRVPSLPLLRRVSGARLCGAALLRRVSGGASLPPGFTEARLCKRQALSRVHESHANCAGRGDETTDFRHFPPRKHTISIPKPNYTPPASLSLPLET